MLLSLDKTPIEAILLLRIIDIIFGFVGAGRFFSHRFRTFRTPRPGAPFGDLRRF